MLEDSAYFNEEYAEFLSNSKLSVLNPAEGGNYETFINVSKKKQTSSFLIGTLVHGLILEPDKYTIKDFEAPSKTITDIFDIVYELTSREKNAISFENALEVAIQTQNYYNGKPGDIRLQTLIEKGQEYYEYLKSESKSKNNEYVLTKAQKQTIFLATDSIKKNKKALNLLLKEDDIFRLESFIEDSFLTEISFNSTTYKLTGKVDFWSINYDLKEVCLVDIKTTSQNVENFMGQIVYTPKVSVDSLIPELIKEFKPGSFQNYHYYRQIYIYKELIKSYLKDIIDDTWTFNCYIIAIQTTYDSRCVVYDIDQNWLDLGRKELDYLLDYLYKSQNKQCCDNVETQLNDILNEL